MTGYFRKMKCFFAGAVIGVCVLFTAGPLQAEASEQPVLEADNAQAYDSCYGLCVAYDPKTDQNIPAVVIALDAAADGSVAVVYTGYQEGNNESITVQGCEADYILSIGEYISAWRIKDAKQGEDFSGFRWKSPVEDEELRAFYYDSSSDISSCATKIIKIDGSEKQGYQMEINNISDFYYYPGALLNSDGYCVGIILDPETAYTEWLDEETFYGGSADTGNSGNDGNADTGNDGNGGSGISGNRGNDRGGSSDHGSMPYLLLAAALAVAVIAAGIMFMKKDKNKDKKESGETFDDTFPSFHMDSMTDVLDSGPVLTPVPKRPNGQKLWLVCSGGYMDGRVYPIENAPITIGRGNPSQLVVCYPGDTPGVSRNHARLYRENGKLMLMDCNSSNGTYVKNMGKMAPMQPREMKAGDVFYIGEKKNRFEIKL